VEGGGVRRCLSCISTFVCSRERDTPVVNRWPPLCWPSSRSSGGVAGEQQHRSRAPRSRLTERPFSFWRATTGEAAALKRNTPRVHERHAEDNVQERSRRRLEVNDFYQNPPH